MSMFKVVGIQDVNFYDQQSRRQVAGTSLHCIDMTDYPYVNGQKIEKFFINADLNIDVSVLSPGNVIDVRFGRKDKFESFEILE